MPLDQKYSLYNDDYMNYWIVMESAIAKTKTDFIEPVKNEDGSIRFYRWRQCLQTVGTRNRNGRLWRMMHLAPMMEDLIIKECYAHGGLPGEAGHPVPATGKVTVERILTIDPLRTSHILRSHEWEGNKLYGIMETLDDGPGCPGHKFRSSIRQGIEPAVSARTMVPQIKNPDGTIDVVGPGRMVCFDWIYVPSHVEAYRDISIPIKDIETKDNFEHVMETFSIDYAKETATRSDKIKHIMDTYKYDIATESLIMDKGGRMSAIIKDPETHERAVVCMAPELKYRREYANYLKNF